MSETLSHSESQAVAQLESIREMVAALTCDYDRLEELKDERAELVDAVKDAQDEVDGADDDDVAELNTALTDAQTALVGWDEDNADELAELTAAAGECESEDDARTRIEDALSLEVRSDWHAIGGESEDSEFCILLCTGGPACRIIGELSSGEPVRARIEHQDWGTPWTEYITTGSDHDALLTYCRVFCWE